MTQILEKNPSIILRRYALNFFDNQGELPVKIMNTLKNLQKPDDITLILVEYLKTQDSFTRKRIIKYITDTYESEKAEVILKSTLRKIHNLFITQNVTEVFRLTNQFLSIKSQTQAFTGEPLKDQVSFSQLEQFQVELIKVLSKFGILDNYTQMVLTELTYKSPSTLVKKTAIEALKNVENPSYMIFQLMEKILEEDPNKEYEFFQKIAFEFFENKKEALLSKLNVRILNTIYKLRNYPLQEAVLSLMYQKDTTKRKKEIKDILDTYQAEDSISVFKWVSFMTSRGVKYSLSQDDFIETLANLSRIRTQFKLVQLFNSKDTQAQVKDKIINILKDLEHPSDEVIQLMTHILEEYLSKEIDGFQRTVEQNSIGQVQQLLFQIKERSPKQKFLDDLYKNRSSLLSSNEKDKTLQQQTERLRLKGFQLADQILKENPDKEYEGFLKIALDFFEKRKVISFHSYKTD